MGKWSNHIYVHVHGQNTMLQRESDKCEQSRISDLQSVSEALALMITLRSKSCGPVV